MNPTLVNPRRLLTQLKLHSFGTLINVIFVIWLLAMIAIPILLWTIGPMALPGGMSLSVVAQAILVLVILYRGLGWRGLCLILAVVLPFSWLLEWVGSTTGFPFGLYHYTDLLIPQIGHVPLIIPFSWLMMLAPSWSIARLLCQRSSGLGFIILSGLAMTAWDLYLDPQMVSWGFWVWEEQPMFLGGYFGIPWLNYLGWLMGAALLTWLVTLVVDIEPLFDLGGGKAAPLHLSGRKAAPLRGIYVITWLLEFGGLAFFWGLPGPAVCGFVGMGALIVRGWWAERAMS